MPRLLLHAQHGGANRERGDRMAAGGLDQGTNALHLFGILHTFKPNITRTLQRAAVNLDMPGDQQPGAALAPEPLALHMIRGSSVAEM